MRYNAANYYELGRVYARDELRRPFWPGQRGRFFDAAVFQPVSLLAPPCPYWPRRPDAADSPLRRFDELAPGHVRRPDVAADVASRRPDAVVLPARRPDEQATLRRRLDEAGPTLGLRPEAVLSLPRRPDEEATVRRRVDEAVVVAVKKVDEAVAARASRPDEAAAEHRRVCDDCC